MVFYNPKKYMDKCLTCGKEIQQTAGKRERKYCGDSCRQIGFLKRNKKHQPMKCLPFEEWNKMVSDNQALLAQQKKYNTQEPRENNLASLVYDLERQLKEVKEEKIPDHRNTSLGKRSWEIEQAKKVSDLQGALSVLRSKLQFF